MPPPTILEGCGFNNDVKCADSLLQLAVAAGVTAPSSMASTEGAAGAAASPTPMPNTDRTGEEESDASVPERAPPLSAVPAKASVASALMPREGQPQHAPFTSLMVGEATGFGHSAMAAVVGNHTPVARHVSHVSHEWHDSAEDELDADGGAFPLASIDDDESGTNKKTRVRAGSHTATLPPTPLARLPTPPYPPTHPPNRHTNAHQTLTTPTSQ